MNIRTDTPRVRELRRTNLELLLSNHTGDCIAPCKLGCPGNTDCQGYVGLIANGEFDSALKLIREKIPLPAAIGRVCPHPCETACRRGLVDEPIAIAAMKRFAADMDIAATGGYIPEIAPETGKSVAIIGGGPYGLSAAYYLRRKGHTVTIIDAMPKLGGMLRYGIPEYRLPKALLNAEIELIGKMGVAFVTDTKVGVDIPFSSIHEKYDAVCIGIGAWVSTGTGAKGEDLPGVIGGIDFLYSVERGKPITMGKRVAVVGGGNTAMDACRTAVRLGAETVYNIYRRTKDEMPADALEIEEAEQEGVVFKNLTNPIEITAGVTGRVKSVKLQIMELGAPDASGRRAPIPVEGKTETIEIDTLILAIGQAVNPAGFDGLDLTRKNGIAYDKETYMTSIPGVFAGGDCGNDKISIAIEAIADAERGAQIIDAYLRGESIAYQKPYIHERRDITEKTFEDRERICRQKLDTLPADYRRDNFLEVVPNGFTVADAISEASRCLECGCGDYFECKLLRYSREYDVQPERFAGEKSETEPETSHPFIVRDMNKCILCGQCVRVCDEVIGAGALGLVGRGFDTAALPTLERPLNESECVSCGMCVSVCPTGALLERCLTGKSVPLETIKTVTTCSFCSVGCSICVESNGNTLIRALPDQNGAVNGGLLCHRGRFGFGLAETGELTSPKIRKNGVLEKSAYYDALILIAKSLQKAQAVYGLGAAAIAVSSRLTNEEMYAAKKLADSIGAKIISFENTSGGIKDVLGYDCSPNTIGELAATGLIVAVGFDAAETPVAALKMRQAAKSGVKTVLVNPFEGYGDLTYASEIIRTENDVQLLREILAELINLGHSSGIAGFDGVKSDLSGVTPSEDACRLAKMYSEAKKAMLVFQQSVVTSECAELLADIALVSGHIGSPRDGILLMKPKNNSQGLANLGITDSADALDGVKALLILGEDPDKLPHSLEFLAVCDTHLTKTAKLANVVIPGTGFAATSGTFTNTENRVQTVRKITDSGRVLPNWKVVNALAHALEHGSNWTDVSDIAAEMPNTAPKKAEPKLKVVSGGKLTDPRQTTDALKAKIDSSVTFHS
jgi:formate dehydrogenase major subunit